MKLTKNKKLYENDLFSLKCNKCGSDATIDYTFDYYGGATGFQEDITIFCDKCDNQHNVVVT